MYAGADGEFTLYEDENDNYDYEKGVYSTITFTWDDARNVLTINERKGSFPGMLNQRKFNVVIVAAGSGNEAGAVNRHNKVVIYEGKKVMINL